MKQVIISHFFEGIKDQEYVLLKYTDIAGIIQDSHDIDLLAISPDDLVNSALNKLSPLLLQHGYGAKVKSYAGHVHLDIIKDSKLIIRFDVLTSFAIFYRLNIKPSFDTWLIAKSINVPFLDSVCKVLPEIENCLVKYFEYCEYYALYDTKKIHYEYVMDSIKDDPASLNRFFSLARHFTSPPLLIHHIPMTPMFATWISLKSLVKNYLKRLFF